MTPLSRQIRGEMRRLTGREYRINFDKLEAAEQLELVRFIRDAEFAKRQAADRARLMPWKRP